MRKVEPNKLHYLLEVLVDIARGDNSRKPTRDAVEAAVPQAPTPTATAATVDHGYGDNDTWCGPDPEPKPTPAVDMERVYSAAQDAIGYFINTRERNAIDAAIAEYQRQKEGVCGSGSPTQCSPSSSSPSSTSSTPEVGQSGATAASRMTDEELVATWGINEFMSEGRTPDFRLSHPTIDRIRAVADAAVRADRVVVSVSDIRRSIIGECSVEVHVCSVANMLRSKGLTVED